MALNCEDRDLSSFIEILLCIRILKHAANCAPLVDDHNPNFVLLDYVSVGQGALAVDKLNGIGS